MEGIPGRWMKGNDELSRYLRRKLGIYQKCGDDSIIIDDLIDDSDLIMASRKSFKILLTVF